VRAKTFVVNFATVDEEGWEVLLEDLKLIEVGVLGVLSFSTGGFSLKCALPRVMFVLLPQGNCPL